MGLLRRVAAKVVGRVRGSDAPAAHTPAPATSAAPVEDAAALASIDCGAQELFERLSAGEFVVIVDVREQPSPSLPGARHLPLSQLAERWQELADADEIVCVCADGAASSRAARLLRQRGLINATRLEGGLPAWTAVGGSTQPAGG